MRFIIQRVQHASVTVDHQITGQIGKGYLVLIGVSGTDTKEIADKMIHKMIVPFIWILICCNPRKRGEGYLSDKYQFFRISNQEIKREGGIRLWVRIPHITRIKRKNKH